MNWIILAFLAAMSFTIMSLLVRKAQILGVGSILVYVYVVLLGGIFALIFLIYKGETIKVSRLALVVLAIAALLSLFGNIFAFKSYETAPNQGYAAAITATHGVWVAILGIFLFKAEFNFIKMVGIIFVVAGIILVGLK